MTSFKEVYNQLNSTQQLAVDTIDGPVMVVAGPGTGKTQLLSMRVANILRKTDALPNNILCLTFTESGATAMRQRLASLIGPDAYKVAIHTFHSFGTEVINHNPEFFYEGARFKPADELSSFEILEPIFKKLPHNSPLAATMNGNFTAIRDVKAAIGQLKKAGLTPHELLSILDHNDKFITKAEPILAKTFDVPRLGKKDIANCAEAAKQLSQIKITKTPIAVLKPLATVCLHEFYEAVDAATESSSTKPLTNWRNRWLERDANKKYVFKDQKRNNKLRTVAKIYQDYLLDMQKKELFDFDDMILNVVQAMIVYPDLRYNLQETYQYVLVDEFQDTNVAQMRLLQSLLDNEIDNGRPNIMAVGDDDQAIYAFQGAEIGNILQFKDLYRDPVIITLTDNYRSTNAVLQSAREVITQGQYRLETEIKNINKTLTAHVKAPNTVSQLHDFVSPSAQYSWIVDEIKKLIKQGAEPNQIAVLARNHKQLAEVLPYLQDAGLAINYERRNNVLEAKHIRALITLARTIVALAEQRFDVAESNLPELLSYDFWGIKPLDIWQLSIDSYNQRRFWLELMLERQDRLRAIAEFLIIASQRSLSDPLEQMLDMLIGNNELQVSDDNYSDEETDKSGPVEEFNSPFRAHYFNARQLNENPAKYLSMLSNLSAIRHKLREYRPDQALTLANYVDFVDLHQKTNINIVDTMQHQEDSSAIQVMTAHKSKGLEFGTVFITSCQEDIWGSGTRSRSSSIKFPHNMPLEPAGQSDDDCLRLFFVAMTRARHNLHVCRYQSDNSGKDAALASFLTSTSLTAQNHDSTTQEESLAKAQEPTWTSKHTYSTNADQKQLLQPKLDKYMLSSTHLNNFLDVANGGPQAFFLQNLLRFPQAMSINAVFGSVMHTVIQRAHVHLSSTGEKRPTEDILHDFELQLQNSRLSERDFSYLLEKGSETLQTYLKQRHESFSPTQKTEFALRKVALGEARLTGSLDLVDFIDNQIIVTDYKTGKAPQSWSGTTDYEKIKLHKYRQQLMMYKILVENSAELGAKYTVNRGILEFVEPNRNGEITLLELDFDKSELEEFANLVQVVWKRIIELDLPDTSKYSANFNGMTEFEQDLLSGKA
ncbi:MAG: ATP-dependent DNA helicase [Candidatus Woesebacteria bacterium]|jgi:DNA helicase-2/ATP-dependent DNA helicase PcrA